MRLIDADELERDLSELYKDAGWLPSEVHFSLNDVISNNWGRTVEAVPVEWIEKYGEENWVENGTQYLIEMLKDWRWENETR